MLRHEVKETEQHFRIAQRRRLLQKNHAIDHGKIRTRWARPPALKLSAQRRPSFGNFLEQLQRGALYGASMTEVNPHPVGGGEVGGIGSSNFARGGFILRLPAERVIVAPVAE